MIIEALKIAMLIIHVGTPANVHEVCTSIFHTPIADGMTCRAFATVRETPDGTVCFVYVPDKDKVPLEIYIELLGHEMIHCAGWTHGSEPGNATKWIDGF